MLETFGVDFWTRIHSKTDVPFQFETCIIVCDTYGDYVLETKRGQIHTRSWKIV